jgi:hypothetical protein
VRYLPALPHGHDSAVDARLFLRPMTRFPAVFCASMVPAAAPRVFASVMSPYNHFREKNR